MLANALQGSVAKIRNRYRNCFLILVNRRIELTFGGICEILKWADDRMFVAWAADQLDVHDPIRVTPRT